MKSAFRYLMFAAALLSPAGMNAVQAADAQMPLAVARPREPSITTSTSDTTGMSRVNGQNATVPHVNATKPGLHAVLLRLEPQQHGMPLSHLDSRFGTSCLEPSTLRLTTHTTQPSSRPFRLVASTLSRPRQPFGCRMV
ncbi:hypothetical protein [Mesorhizobium sp. AA23]|uniref:hypothetical protein n=1 Tax=Mesorhizobium sp. AA23 TaxID=1854058 RepID=UPI0007FFE29D|nr:hypothetical protein [Mesorhizobium sp. AA23]OBQ89377.1 hypothetical protein A9K66_18345 [Mesorhizobium sp. AA23]